MEVVHALVGEQLLAYVGPGLGLGTIAVVLGILASVFLALFSVVWYPFKRLLKRFAKPAEVPSQRDSA